MARATKSLPKQVNAVSANEFRVAMRQVASPVAIITTIHSGQRAGLTATAICSATTDPPTILVCVNQNARTEAAIAASGRLVVNFLTEDQHEIARLFSTSKLDFEKRFAAGEWFEAATGAPVLKGSLASFDCSVESVVYSGTHSIYVSRVEAVASNDGSPLLYRDGYFRRLGTQF
jgi:flavin reductase (DIM6/NTAB) family NADH-FMN oxidoreductase RutF